MCHAAKKRKELSDMARSLSADKRRKSQMETKRRRNAAPRAELGYVHCRATSCA